MADDWDSDEPIERDVPPPVGDEFEVEEGGIGEEATEGAEALEGGLSAEALVEVGRVGAEAASAVRRYGQAVRQCRTSADRVLDRMALPAVDAAWSAAMGPYERAMRQLFQGRLGDLVQPGDTQRVLQQGEILLRPYREALRAYHGTQRMIAAEGLRSVEDFWRQVSQQSSALENVQVHARLLEMQIRHATQSRLINESQLVGRVPVEMGQKLLQIEMKGVNVREFVGRAADLTEDQWWQMERLVRTETSRSYNQAQSDAITEIARTTPGLWKRWTELVDDWSGSPLDNKVARDSLVLHGQVARVDGHFTMPPDQRAPAVMVGKTWAQPPNRPNDRAVLTPWMREWGIPAWAWQGAKVWLSGSNARA
jgi:hypothetical protein